MQTLDVSIIKSTNHNKVPPKEKHIKGTIWRLRMHAVWYYLFVHVLPTYCLFRPVFPNAEDNLCVRGTTLAALHHQSVA